MILLTLPHAFQVLSFLRQGYARFEAQSMAWQQTTAAQLETIAAQQRLLLEAVRGSQPKS